MARPRKSTKDEWLDQFADWDAETQEQMIDTCELLHRQTKRREGRRPEPQQQELRQHVAEAHLTVSMSDLKDAAAGPMPDSILGSRS